VSEGSERIDREDVAVERDEIAALARLQATGCVLLLKSERRVNRVGIDDVLDSDTLLWKQWLFATSSVEKLSGRILLENAKALERLKFERAEGSAISDDISSQSIVVRQGIAVIAHARHRRPKRGDPPLPSVRCVPRPTAGFAKCGL